MNIKIKSSANIANILSNKIKIKKSRPISLKQWDLSTCPLVHNVTFSLAKTPT